MDQTENAYQPKPLEITTTVTDGVTVVSVSGEIDHNTADPLIQALEVDALAGRPQVVIDMRRVPFMDSSGINVLLAAHRQLTEADGWLRLAGVHGSVQRVLQLVGLDTVIACHANLRDALTA
ncbi:STAS domain-containing protein [Streptomyces sp. 1222.5]|uniref:STAS domain-containing protein n=1 Tax=Streptomyces sp. 1222.5 TaxID=1881026 RepID=UPI003EB99487